MPVGVEPAVPFGEVIRVILQYVRHAQAPALRWFIRRLCFSVHFTRSSRWHPNATLLRRSRVRGFHRIASSANWRWIWRDAISRSQRGQAEFLVAGAVSNHGMGVGGFGWVAEIGKA